MKVWITKNVLTNGIREIDGAERSSTNPDMIAIYVDLSGLGREYFHREGHDWHLTRKSAVARANAMVATKINGLRKQIENLENLSFE